MKTASVIDKMREDWSGRVTWREPLLKVLRGVGERPADGRRARGRPKLTLSGKVAFGMLGISLLKAQ